MTHTIRTIQEKSNNKIIFFSLLAFAVLMLGIYMYFIQNSVQYTTLKKSSEKDISKISLSIANLSATHYTIKNSIDEKVALERGFILNKNPNFISVKSLGKANSLSHEI